MMLFYEDRGLAMGKRVAIVQSNYIPWKGYFDLIASVDEFIVFDSVQYTRRDWRNRNQIKTSSGLLWLTIPVEAKGRYEQSIKDVTIADKRWTRRHWETIRHNYAQASAFSEAGDLMEGLYRKAEGLSYLSAINQVFLHRICEYLEIRTKLSASMDYVVVSGKSERLVALCRQAGANVYVSGPSARAYLDESAFQAAGIHVEYFDYSGYPIYRQLHPPFEHAVSVIDLILNEGRAARRYLKIGRPAERVPA
jgi:hypothetical protein